jgi:hypothetical protein
MDKRRFPRARLTCKISASFADRLLVFDTHTENIGAGGIRTILEERLNDSTVVDLDLFLPGRELPLRCKGRVAWAKEIDPFGIRPRLFDTGIEFVGLDELNQQELKKTISEIIAQEKGPQDS